MDTILIPCPECGRELKLRDRSLLGKKGKCPKCGYTFVLAEPEDEVQLELAESEPSPVGTSARWVPDNASPATAPPRAPAARTQTAPSFAAAPSLGDLESLASAEGTTSRLKTLQKQRAKQRNIGLAVGAVVLAVAGGVGYFAISNASTKPTRDGNKVVEVVEADNPAAENDALNDLGVVINNDYSKAGNPTKGKPIQFQFIPFGTQVAFHIHPAELWKTEKGEELRYCLDPVAKLLVAKLNELFKRKPEQIEEAQICLIPGPQGSLPEVAAVIRLVEEVKKSQLLEDFGGERIDDYGHPVYITGERAYLIHDQKTIAVGPKAQANEMVEAIARANPASDGLDELMPLTDRDRHITVIFVPRALRLHANFWFPENLRPLVIQFCDWLGDDVESATWSFHLGERVFYSDMLLRNVTGATTSRLEKEVRTKLDKLPSELLDTVRMMNPREVGKRKVIGRVPKMSEAYAMSTMASHGPRHVQLITPLPERAAPNLALGTLLAWDESTRTDFSKKATTKPPPSDSAKLPDLIADRLKLKIDVDFRRMPLQEAFAYIGGEIKTTIDIDGDGALKSGGFTKNMPQEFKLDGQPAKVAIAKILEKYQDPKDKTKQMAIVVDEAKKQILITTVAWCEKDNLTPFDLTK